MKQQWAHSSTFLLAYKILTGEQAILMACVLMACFMKTTLLTYSILTGEQAILMACFS
jgi:hypothetical protein